MAKWVFEGWSEDGHGISGSTTDQVTMNSPHTIEVIWNADYRLPLSIIATLVILSLAILYSRRRSRKRKRLKSRRSHRNASSKRGGVRPPPSTPPGQLSFKRVSVKIPELSGVFVIER